MTGEFITVRMISEKLGVSKMSVHRWINRGELRAFKVGGVVRVSVVDFNRFMRNADTWRAS